MPTSVAALWLFALTVLPGLLFVVSFESAFGRSGVDVRDRTLRIVAMSLAFSLPAASLIPLLYMRVLHVRAGAPLASPHYRNLLLEGSSPWWLWALAVAYLFVPLAMGFWAGWMCRRPGRRRQYFSHLVIGGPRIATAWARVFDDRTRRRVIRAKIADGGVIAGVYGSMSNSSVLNEMSADLFLQDTYELTLDNEIQIDSDGLPKHRGIGVLLRREDVRWLEIFDAPKGW